MSAGHASGSRAASRKGPSSYPGGKSGAGVYQRLINEIPPHDMLIVPFAGRCGVTRRIRPAEHTILIDRDGNLRYLHRGYKAGYEVEDEKQVKELVRER